MVEVMSDGRHLGQFACAQRGNVVFDCVVAEPNHLRPGDGGWARHGLKPRVGGVERFPEPARFRPPARPGRNGSRRTRWE